MIGAAAPPRFEIAMNCVAGVVSQALSSSASASSTTAKSAAAALSVIATRTVASLGSSVKLTWRSACQGAEAISTVPESTAMQGRGDGKNSTRARIAAAIRGTAETRIFKRNMERHSLNHTREESGLYGWRSVKKTRYRLVDVCPSRRHVASLFRERAIGQRFGEMQPGDVVGAVEIGERAGDAQHAMIAARGKAHGLGGIAQQFLALRVGLGDVFQQRSRRFRVGADVRQAGLRVTLELDVARGRDAGGDFGGAFRRWRQDQVGRGDRGHLDAKIDPVHQRTGNAHLVV